MPNNDLKELQNEFYFRYSGSIYKQATYVCRYQPDAPDLAKDILSLTFTKAFDKIASLKIGKEVNEPEVPYIVKAWLGRIANNEYFSYARKFGKESYPLPDDSTLPSNETTEIDLKDIPFEKILFEKALGKLKERDRHILLLYADYNCIGTKNHLPENIMKYLCDTYKIKPDNIRQIKKRTLQQVKLLMSNLK